MFFEEGKMRTSHTHQPLSYDVRLPDEAQADALRLLDASRAVVNASLVKLWPQLDDFMGERSGPAWKQVAAMMGSPDPHGDRQWRCEAETVGRILRGQAERKQVFLTLLPILSDGFIRPKTEQRPAGKNRKHIKEAIDVLAKSLEDDETSFVTMQNVVEQACNHFLQHDTFPSDYEEMQSIPLLKTGLLTYAGDDGPKMGQSYRLTLDLDAGTAALLFRFPNEQGVWQWRKTATVITLPQIVKNRLKEGENLSPTLREYVHPDGSRMAVLDFIVNIPKAPLAAWNTMERVLGFDWGVHGLITAVVLDAESNQIGRPFFLNTGGIDGRQARTRRQIDELKAKRERFAPDDPRRVPYNQEIARGKAFEASGGTGGTMRRSEVRSGRCSDTRATWLASASALNAHAAPRIPVPVAGALSKPIVPPGLSIEAIQSNGVAGWCARTVAIPPIAIMQPPSISPGLG